MRIRSIKPAFYKDEDLAEHSPLTRILFTGLWGLADREGRLEYRPKYIKAEVLPYDDADIPAMLSALNEAGFIQIYEGDSRQLIQIVNFKKHQRINGKEAGEASEFPSPQEKKKRGSNREATGKQSGSDRAKEIRQGREGKGREGNTEGNTEGKGVAPVNGAALVPEILDPETPMQLVIRAWKIQTGVDPDDKAWDQAHYKRHLRPAQSLLNLFSGDVGAAVDCIEIVYRQLVEQKGLDLSLQGVVNNSGRFRQEWLERKSRQETGVS